MQIIKINDTKALTLALQCLEKGGILIYPTETAYGVGVDATNKYAVDKVLKFKKRPEGKAISIGVSSHKMALKYVHINKTAQNLYDNFLPGALTVISKSKNMVDSRLESNKNTLGIRIPNYKFLLDLIQKLGKPITATSANSSGKKTPYTIKDITDNLNQKQLKLIDLIIDAGDLAHNPPSTVIDTTEEELTTYRQGRINPQQIIKIFSYESYSTEETILRGRNMIEKIINDNQTKKETILILINGELGAGKTHFSKGIAEYLGIKDIIKSPTYNYVNEYIFQIKDEGIYRKGVLYHMDAWKIQELSELKALKFYEWFKDDNIIIVEWPSVIMNLDNKFFDKVKYFYIDLIVKSNIERKIKIFEVN